LGDGGHILRQHADLDDVPPLVPAPTAC